MRSLPRFPAILACLVAALVLVLGAEARAVVFGDGGLHAVANGYVPTLARVTRSAHPRGHERASHGSVAVAVCRSTRGDRGAIRPRRRTRIA
jgi:hypothetical protein